MLIHWDRLAELIHRQEWLDRINKEAQKNPPLSKDGISVLLSPKGVVDVLWEGQNGQTTLSFMYFTCKPEPDA